jgi:hypothetical protein
MVKLCSMTRKLFFWAIIGLVFGSVCGFIGTWATHRSENGFEGYGEYLWSSLFALPSIPGYLLTWRTHGSYDWSIDEEWVYVVPITLWNGVFWSAVFVVIVALKSFGRMLHQQFRNPAIKMIVGVSLLFYLSGLSAQSDSPIPISGGFSPNGKVAVVVKGDEDTSQASVSVGNEHPYLQNVRTKKIIGPLEEVETIGGGFGHVLENVTGYWSPDSRFVAVRFRAGRLSENFIIYQIKPARGGYRAMPQKLPESTSGPNGAKIFDHASHGANMGDIFEKWLSPTEIAVTKYRFFPPYPPEPDADFFDGDGRIEVLYSNRAGTWVVSGYKKPTVPGASER